MSSDHTWRARAVRTDPRPPGRLVTDLVIRLSLRAGESVAPFGTPEGLRFRLRPAFLRGGGEVTVSSEGDGSRVVLAGNPPLWPLSWRWADRTLDGLLAYRQELAAAEELPAEEPPPSEPPPAMG